MAFLKTLFSKQRAADSSTQENVFPCKLLPKTISIETLKRLIPVRNLSQDELTAFTLGAESEVFGAKTTLFKLGEPVESVIYLIEGTVSLQTEGGTVIEISADAAKARFPLSSGRQHGSTATALTDIRVIRISSEIMGGRQARNESLVKDLAEVDTQGQLKNSRLFHTFCQNYQEGDLILPTLPNLAIKFRQATEQDIGTAEAVKIIQLDSAIAAKLVRVANSPLYLAATPVNSCFEAVNRLGLAAVRNLVLSFCLKEIFSNKNPKLKAMCKKQWKRSINMSSLCYVLAAANKEFVDPEEALLAGLLCDIGALPFLHFTENFPEQYYEIEELEIALPLIRGPVGSLILSKWGFTAELARIPMIAEDWYHESSDKLSLADIVILAKLHSYIGNPEMAQVPAISSIPACGKLKDGTLSPEQSLNVLHEAKEKIRDTLLLFDV